MDTTPHTSTHASAVTYASSEFSSHHQSTLIDLHSANSAVYAVAQRDAVPCSLPRHDSVDSRPSRCNKRASYVHVTVERRYGEDASREIQRLLARPLRGKVRRNITNIRLQFLRENAAKIVLVVGVRVREFAAEGHARRHDRDGDSAGPVAGGRHTYDLFISHVCNIRRFAARERDRDVRVRGRRETPVYVVCACWLVSK
jgi:hypothetical protein